MAIFTIHEVFTLVDALGGQVVKYPGMPFAAIDAVEKSLRVRFPEAYRLFLSRYGALKVGPITIYGMTLPPDREPSLVWALRQMWASSPDVPKNLIPVHSEKTGFFSCLQCQETGSIKNDAPVVLWNLNAPLKLQNLEPQSPDLGTYLYNRLLQRSYREAALNTMKQRVREFEEKYLKIGKLPRNHVWRPYRFCVQDVLLGLVVVRHSLENNCLDVDVCLTSDVPEYEPGSGARMTSAFLLSEAYKCGETMEIRFSENVENGRVPVALDTLAQGLGVQLSHVEEGRITPSEARQFYVALAEFPQTLRDKITALSIEGKITQESVCYAVLHGIWTRPEVDSIVNGSLRPDSVFSGAALPEQRALYMQDALHARAAVLGGFLDRKLARRERVDGKMAVDLEDDTRRLRIEFDPHIYAKVYRCDEDLPLPWLAKQNEGHAHIVAGQRLVTLVRARDASDLELYLMNDISVATQLAKSMRQSRHTDSIAVLFPRDFEQLSPAIRDSQLAKAQKGGISIMVCPETVVSLDSDATRRLASSRVLRQ